MTSGEALRELNAAEDETRRQFNSYVSYAMMVGSQTEKKAIKSKRIITAALIGGSSVLGTIFLLIGGRMMLFGILFIGILLIGIGTFSGIMYNSKADGKIVKIKNDRQNLENSINSNSNY